MTFDAWDVLACPRCGGALSRPDDKRLSCAPCRRDYPIEGGAPVLLPEGAAPVAVRAGRGASWGFLHAPMGLHVGGADDRFARMTEGKRVVNVGAKTTGRLGWINLDITRHGPSVDVVGDAHHLPVKSGAVGGVALKFVLEHVPDPAAVVAEAHRVLAPNGVFFVTVPFVQPYHADPGDYQRYSVDGLRRLCAAFHVVESGAYYGPASAVAEIMRELAASFFDTWYLKKAARFAAGWLFWPFKYADLYLGRKRSAADLAYGVYLIGRKEV